MATRLAQIIRMGKVGGYSVRLGGVLLEANGRVLWPSVESLRMDIGRLGVAMSDLIIDTGSFIAPLMEYRRAA